MKLSPTERERNKKFINIFSCVIFIKAQLPRKSTRVCRRVKRSNITEMKKQEYSSNYMPRTITIPYTYATPNICFAR